MLHSCAKYASLVFALCKTSKLWFFFFVFVACFVFFSLLIHFFASFNTNIWILYSLYLPAQHYSFILFFSRVNFSCCLKTFWITGMNGWSYFSRWWGTAVSHIWCRLEIVQSKKLFCCHEYGEYLHFVQGGVTWMGDPT